MNSTFKTRPTVKCLFIQATRNNRSTDLQHTEAYPIECAPEAISHLIVVEVGVGRDGRSALALRRQPCRWSSRLVAGRINRAHARSCEEAVLASLTWICDAEQLYTDAALVLDASTRVAAVARSGQIDLHLHCVVDHADETGWVAGCIHRALDLVCIMSICDAEQLYTDAALVLDASTRVAAAAGKRPHRSVH